MTLGLGITVRVAKRTKEAIAAIALCRMTLERIVEDQPWNSDAREALAALNKADENLTWEKVRE